MIRMGKIAGHKRDTLTIVEIVQLFGATPHLISGAINSGNVWQITVLSHRCPFRHKLIRKRTTTIAASNLLELFSPILWATNVEKSLSF
jgi:hypothetical protein